MPSAKPRVFSGTQPSGGLHLGNYLGAIRNWVRNQDRYDNIFCVVDLHALTLPWDAKLLRENTLQVAAIYLACGISQETSTIFVQSRIPAHSELAWILTCLTPMGWLERMTQFKDKSAGEQRERVGTGLFTYPALMAADILLYDTNFVPVGEDQRQHIEYTRDLAQRVNQRFGDVFTLPQALIPEAGARIMGLDDPVRKMSKTLAQANPGHAIFLTDPPDSIRKKFARAQTDAEPAVRFPAGAGVTNLLDIYRSLTGSSADAVRERFEGKSYSELKATVAEATIDVLRPIQERYREIRSDDAQLVRDLDRAAERLAVRANATLGRVKRVTGLLGHD